VSDPVTYTGVLPIGEHTVARLARLLADDQRQRRTRKGRRALNPWRHAVLVLRWFLDATRVAQLTVDNGIGRSTAYRYLHEGIDALAATAPSLHGALLAAKTAGHTHVALDGTLVRTDRSETVGPTTTGDGRTVDLWWSGKHHHHGGNVQVVTAPDGWPLWVSGVRPGREHDVTCARAHPELLSVLDTWSDDDRTVLADLGYEGENDRLVCPVKSRARPAARPSPSISAPETCCTPPPAPSPNAGTPCSRPASKRYGGSACVPGESARSPPPRSCCSTPSTTGPLDQIATGWSCR